MEKINRCKRLLVPPAVAVAVTVFAAAPASASKGGSPAPGSCGLGTPGAYVALQDQTSPGATENALISPQEFGCTGNGG
jgi:hypothetical protein